MSYIIELEPGVYRSIWSSGDPPRTLKIDKARRYTSENSAKLGLARARTYRAFPNARILFVAEERTKLERQE